MNEIQPSLHVDIDAPLADNHPDDVKKAAIVSTTVAIVEDDERIRRSLATILSSEKDLKLVGTFSSAEAALEELPTLQPRVLLMDVNPPGIDGVECVRRLSGQLRATQALLALCAEDILTSPVLELRVES
ncbi:MAG: response regulator [Verrucomicrobiota bacterium]